MAHRKRQRPSGRALIVVAITSALLTAVPTAAQEPSTEEQLDDVREQSDSVATEINVLEAKDAEIQAALDAIQAEVAGQQVVVTAAEDALDIANAELADATAAVEELETRVAMLDAATEAMVVEAFVDPPTMHALEMFQVDTLSDATVKEAIVGLQADADEHTLEELASAQAELDDEQANKEDAAAAATQKKAEADNALVELEDSLAAQEALATEVEARINAKLAEAVALQASDAELSQQLADEQAALAAALAAAEAQPAPSASTITPVPGGLATVSCPGGGSITVAGTIAANVQALLDAAAADGLAMCGGGYRDPAEQIALREAHCGTSDYAIYEMPASECDPPTARPGSSMHETGLAIDFTCNGGGAIGTSSPCYDWLVANAATYGLFNLPAEPWHWSTNGN